MRNLRSPYPGWHYVPYPDLTPDQQEQVKQNLLNNNLKEEFLGNFEFLIEKATGRVTRA